MGERTGVRGRYQVTFVVLVVGVAAFSLLQSLVIPVLTTLQHSLHTTQDTVEWLLTGYLLSAAVFTPIMGRIGDIIGKERVLVVTLVALGVGSLLAAIASSIDLMIVARAVQGIGGGVMPLSFGIIRDEFPPEKVGVAVGRAAGLTALGGGLGIVLAGPIVTVLNYHWLFWIPMIMVLLAAVAVHLVVPESPVRSKGRVNVGAALLLSGWLVALLLAVTEGPIWGWASSATVGFLVAAAVLAATWVLVELRSPRPLIDMHMMRIPAVWTTNLVALLFGMGVFASFAFVPELVQTPTSTGYGFGASIIQSGLFLLPQSATSFLFGVLSGGLVRRLGAKLVLFSGAAVAVVPYLMLALAHHRRWEIYVAMGVSGIGFGLTFAAMANVVVQAVPADQTGVATGMNANIRTIGGSIGTGVMSSIVAAGTAANAYPPEAGYVDGFFLMAAVTAVAALAALLIPSTRRRPAGDVHPHAELGMLAAGTLAEPE